MLLIKVLKQIISIARFDCKILCNEPNLTILIGNERWEFHLLIDAKIIEKDWIDAILRAIWVGIHKIYNSSWYCYCRIILLYVLDVAWLLHDIQTIQKTKKNIKMKENN